MADLIFPPLDESLTARLILYRTGVRLLRAIETDNNLTREAIEQRQWWFTESGLDLPQRGLFEETLAMFQQNLIQGSFTEENLRQTLEVDRNDLFDLVMDSPLGRQINPPLAIRCRTIRDIEAVHTLSRLGIWPQHQVPGVGIDRSLNANLVVPPQYLAYYALSLGMRFVPC